jgi:transcriptional regulator with XRE-family HTH domain
LALWRRGLPRSATTGRKGVSCMTRRATRPRSLGAELRRARVAAGFTSQEALAARLGYDRTVIAKAETGERPPTSEVADALEAELFAGGPSGLVGRLAGLARRTDGPVPAWFEDWLEAEREALTLRYWQPIIIPGLFQTAEYARALLLAAQTDTSDEAIGALVGARLARRVIFDKPDPPDVVVVLDESVLHRLIGSPQVMFDQLSEIAGLSTGRVSRFRWCRPVTGPMQVWAER